jgi:FkbM family methyltransferase
LDQALSQHAAAPAAAAPLPTVFRDLQRHYPAQPLRTLFDVGANIGQSALLYAHHFPAATIWAAEPTDHSFAALTEAASGFPGIRPVQVAFGEAAGTLRMTMKSTWTRNHITTAPLSDVVREVQVRRFDEFCMAEGIGEIDFLKIDTEGYDLDVLKGATGMLPRIAFVQTEVSMNRYNRFHVSFQEVFDFMSDHGFMVYNIYGLAFENREIGVLRRADPVFINSRLVPSLAGRLVSR